MFPHLQQAPTSGTQLQHAQHPPPPPSSPPSQGRKFRQRSRSFDAAFLAQLQAFEMQRQAHAKSPHSSSSSAQHQQQQQHQMMMAAAMSMPHYHAMAMPPLAGIASPPVSPRPAPNRERQLRSAYLSPSGLSLRPASPPISPAAATAASSSASSSHNSSRYHSPRAARGQLMHSPPPPGSMQSGAAAGYPGMLSPGLPLFPMQPLLFPGLVPPHQLLQQTQLLQLQHQQLLQHMQMQQAPGGRPFYGFINVGASSPRPGQPPPASAAAAAPAPTAAPFPFAASPLFNPAAHSSPASANGAATVTVTPKKPRVLHVHPTVPGENHARSPRPHAHAQSQAPRSMRELHNDYVEVIYHPHLASSQQAAQRKKDKKQKAARAAALAAAAGVEAAAASAAVVPEAPPLTVAEQKIFAKLASAAMLAEIQARKDQLNARMRGREAAALQRITEQEAERTRAAELEKEKAKALAAAKAKQREAMAESALSRAKQAEQSKARSALLDEIEAKAKERENKALARLKAQQGPASLFNPTLAYALKVESSHHRGDARSSRKGDINRGSISGGHRASVAGFSADKAQSAHSHARKHSLYDGMDIDMMAAAAAAASTGGAAGGGGGTSDDPDVVLEEDEDAIDEQEEGEGGEPHEEGQAGGEEEPHEEEKQQEHSQQQLSLSGSQQQLQQQQQQQSATGAPQHHSPTHKDSAAAAAAAAAATASAAPVSTTPKSAASAAGASPRKHHNRSLSSIAKEHIASQLNKMSTKHTGASVKLQRLRTQTKARAQAAQAEKQRKMDEIRWAREAELRRMAAALTAMEASTAGGAKVESQFVLAMPLAKAAKAGDLQAIEELSRDKAETGGDVVAWVNRHDSAGSTAIFHATWMAHGSALQLLFAKGALPNHQNNRKNSALHLACDRAHYAIIKLLLEHGADPSLQNHEHQCCYEMQSRTSTESLEMALYIRQCLEDLILLQSGVGEAAEGVGLGMASVSTSLLDRDYSAGGVEGAKAAAAAADAKATAAAAISADSAASAAAAVVDPVREARVQALASAVSSRPAALSLPHSYLAAINAYISKRLHLTASLRRVKFKIWSAVRVKLRLGAFSSMAKQRAIEAQREAEMALAAEAAAAAAAQDAGQQSEAEDEEEEEKEGSAEEQEQKQAAESEVPAA